MPSPPLPLNLKIGDIPGAAAAQEHTIDQCSVFHPLNLVEWVIAPLDLRST